MGIIKDIGLYYDYKKIIRKNKSELQSKFKIKIDNADRMYTVLNLPPKFFEEPYNLRKSDIDVISNDLIKEYTEKLSEYLNSIGLMEMYTFYNDDTKKIDKYSYLLVIGFKQVNSVEYNTLLYRRLIPVLLVIGILGLSLLILL